MQHFSHLPINSQLSYFSRLHQLIETHQGGNVFFLPHSGLMYRLAQFLAWERKQHNYKLRIFDLNLPVNNPLSLGLQLDHSTTPLVVVAHRQFIGPDRVAFGEILQSAHTGSSQPILIFHECAPSELNLATLPSLLYQNHFLYPLPHLVNLPAYFNNLARDWRLKLTPAQTKDIISLCGNQLWLANEYLRQLMIQPGISSAQIATNQVFREKSEQIWQFMPTHYRDWIIEPTTRLPSLTEEFAAFNLVDQNFNLYGSWSIPLIKLAQSANLEVNPHSIIYKGRDLTAYFTPKERGFLASLIHQGDCLAREQAAQLIWGSNWPDLYSDWALDQSIRRLRQKLGRLQLPILINTKRGAGYVYARLPG